MPRLSGIEATRAITEAVPSAKVIMLTVSEDEDDLLEAVKAGAAGYLLKEISIDEVAAAIRCVVERPEPHLAVDGGASCSPSSRPWPGRSTSASRRPPRGSPSGSWRSCGSWRKGLSNREIAGELYISENTVKNHVRNILEKLHLHSRMEAVVYAVREKLLDIRVAPGEGPPAPQYTRRPHGTSSTRSSAPARARS